MHITIEDINKRISSLNDNNIRYNSYMESANLFTKDGKFCEQNAIDSIKNWQTLSENNDLSFNKALDIFDSLCENTESVSVIKTVTPILVEAVNKVRDQAQLKNSLKYRLAIMKKKPISKLIRSHNNITSAIISNVNKLKAPNITTGGTINTKDVKDAVQESYEEIINKSKAVYECDRIINNYKNIKRRFNLDNVLSEVRTNDDLYISCIEIAKLVDTFNTSFKSKYNAALECAAYVIDKHFMNYQKSNIISAVTDYFLFSGVLKENHISDIKYIRKISPLFEYSDFESISWALGKESELVQESNNEIKVDIESYGVDFKYLTEEDIEVKKVSLKDYMKGNPDERKDQDIKDMVDDFKSKCLKNPESKSNILELKSLISKIYTKSPYQIVYNLPNIFTILRALVIVMAIAINPIVGIITFITDQLIKCGLSRKQLEKVIKNYNTEIKSVDEKIEKAKDEDTKEKYEKYKEELKKDLKKIEEYERIHYTECENDERDEAKYASEIDDDFDFDFGEFDDDFNLDEVAKIICIDKYIDSINESLVDSKDLDGIVFNNIIKLDNDSLDTLTDLSIAIPIILDRNKLIETFTIHRNDIRKKKSNIKDYIRIDCLNENIYRLSSSSYSYNTSNSINDVINSLSCVDEIAKLNNNYLIEMDFTNSIKLALNTLKHKVSNLGTKEKQISSSIDVSANNVSKAIEDALTKGSREAVIKGRLIPSTSKTIKWALTLGVAWAISPAIAVITAIGAFACMKKLQAKERQLVLDDIEIEIKMCERYIRNYEDKGDLKKVKQCETILRNLERQRQRIKYKMVTVYSQNVPSVNKDD